MTHLDELDNYLSNYFSIDNWSDSGIEHAISILQDLKQDDWKILSIVWKDRNSQWQQYCAQILPWGTLQYSLPMLLSMLQANNDDVIILAADALRELDSSIVKEGLTPLTKQHLEQIAQNRSGITSVIINDFLKRISSEEPTKI